MLSNIMPDLNTGVEGRGRSEEETWTGTDATRALGVVARRVVDFMIMSSSM
jgi:hypothetical protein